jgi:hypothetical protein
MGHFDVGAPEGLQPRLPPVKLPHGGRWCGEGVHRAGSACGVHPGVRRCASTRATLFGHTEADPQHVALVRFSLR